MVHIFEMYFSYAVAVLWLSSGCVANQLFISCSFEFLKLDAPTRELDNRVNIKLNLYIPYLLPS